MSQDNVERQSGAVAKDGDLAHDGRFSREEVQLALRNRGMPLEGLRYDITPTGMHYLLVHFDIPAVDAEEWRLAVGGLVENSMSLTLDDVKSRPARTITVTMECAGNGRALMSPRPVSQPWLLEAVGTAQWTGTPLRGILQEAGITNAATEILFTGLDQGIQGDEVHYYQRSLSIEEATHEDVLLAYLMNGEPLQPQHGYPLRLIVPGWYGMAAVKWLSRIEAIEEPFQGYQMAQAYRYSQSADDPGEPVTLTRVRALMAPPGIPDFLTRRRLVEAGRVTLAGRAWAGRSGIARVEVSMDAGATWADAQLGEEASRYAWRAWSFEWQAEPGTYTLSVRATDSVGNTQPTQQAWNYCGMGNNIAQQVEVVVK